MIDRAVEKVRRQEHEDLIRKLNRCIARSKVILKLVMDEPVDPVTALGVLEVDLGNGPARDGDSASSSLPSP